MTKFIFVTGGVLSSLGKGITSASIATILKQSGFKVSMLKIDPYLNVDPGTMSPLEHGEVFVTADGAETDLDLGNYERFIDRTLTKINSFTTGQVYQSVIKREREGGYLGKTIQVIPHVVDEIKNRIFAAAEGNEFLIIEIGGTVGDIESLPFLEAIRSIRHELPKSNTMNIHVSLVPYIKAAGELKTKPTQHSVQELRRIGITPHMLVCRTEKELPKALKDKLAHHPALRHLGDSAFPAPQFDVMPDVRAVRTQMAEIVEKLRSGSWKGYSGDTIRHVVNIGIGGSDLGPKMATRALSAFAHPGLHVHYVSNLDGAHLAPLLETLDPRGTLFIIASKTFTTQETMINAASARNWMLAHTGDEAALAKHFIAVSAHPERAAEFGIPPAQVLPMWDWVGGRYSLWSAVGLPLAVSIGMSGFERLLAGAQAMDQHFCQTPLKDNLPALLALLGIWNTNFLGAHTSAIVPYNESLRHLPGYLQQLEMESNGKTVNRDGQPLTCPANPIVWGEIGANGQHAFFQLLHQGGWLVPCDFIATALSDYPLPGHQAPLLANCFAQSAALAFGKTEAEARSELEAAGLSDAQRDALLPHKVFAGNQPSTTLLLPRLDPYHLGLLLALYEHKVFVQGVIWGINSFDQWGVELGKQLASRVLPVLNGDAGKESLDASTRGLIDWTQTTHG